MRQTKELYSILKHTPCVLLAIPICNQPEQNLYNYRWGPWLVYISTEVVTTL